MILIQSRLVRWSLIRRSLVQHSLILGVAILWLSAPVFGQGPLATKEVTDSERLKFDQEKVAANMRELEDRMIKLANLLRDAKPDDSARLLLGVESAREQLILEQMNAASELLKNVDFGQATEEQKQVLEKLSRLKGLLLNVDLELRIRLEQLKKLAEARQQLNELVAKEEKQKAATSAAGRAGKPTAPLQANEQRNQKASDHLEQQVRKVGGSGEASKSIGKASQSMGKASASLGQGKSGSANESQQKAIEELQKAQEQLGELKKQMQQQAEAAARQRVNELLAEMLNRQTKVREATVDALTQFEKQTTEAIGLLGRLAQVEDQIIAAAAECIEICELTEFSMVLPTALRDIREHMNHVRSQLEQGNANDELVANEEQIIADLKELIAAMQDAGKPGSPKKSSEKEQKAGAEDRNKLVAEVKLLYWMQKSVSRSTKKIREQELSGNLDAVELEQKTKVMMQQQDKILEVTENLRELASPGLPNGRPADEPKSAEDSADDLDKPADGGSDE